MDAYIYLRVSSTGQQYNSSFGRQLSLTQQLCEKMRWPIRGVFGEVCTGMTLHRPILTTLVGLITNYEKPAIIVCESLDRFTRAQLDEYLDAMADLRDRKIQIVCADDDRLDASLRTWFKAYLHDEYKQALRAELNRDGSGLPRMQAIDAFYRIEAL